MLGTMCGFYGIATTDGYSAYGRFDADGRRQTCWARRLRKTGHLAGKYGGSVPLEVKRVRQELHGDPRSVH